MARKFTDQDWNAFVTRRPEFANAEQAWQQELEPELARRDSERAELIKTVGIRAASAGLPTLILLSLFGVPVFLSFVLGVAAAAAASAIPAIKIYGFKSGVKDLVLTSAAQSFGFTYNTLHEDVSGINSWRAIRDLAISKAKEAKPKTFKLFSADDVEDTPTPAFPVLRNAKLLPAYNDKKFEDLIEGERAGAKFSLVECKLTEEQGSGKNRRTVTVFQGVLLHIAYPQNFLGRTLLARSGTWKWGKGWKDLQEVKLVSVELDKAFTVYSNDQVEARALLTPDRMERLIALERFFEGGKLRGIFEGDHLTFALEAQDQFEVGSMFQSLVNPAHYRKALHEMGLVCDLIDGFLTREWAQSRL